MFKKLLTQIIPKGLGVWGLMWFILQLLCNPQFEPILIIKIAEILLALYAIIFIAISLGEDI